jgi:hypothetical protein
MASRFHILAGVLGLCIAGSGLAQSSRVKARDLYLEAEPSVEKIHHLGLRYNLLQVNPTTRESRAVDPDANFSKGDCFALEFSPNRAGNLYIFNRGSSGDLRQLLPSAEMPAEASRVVPDKAIRVPQEYCFGLTDPPGVEMLIVAVTERPEDVKDLRESATASVRKWEQQQLAGRDIIVEKVDAPESPTEQPHTVYVVRTGSAEPTRLVMEVKIRHE